MAKPKTTKTSDSTTQNPIATQSYASIDDSFIARYLTRDGETVEQAKLRLQNALHPNAAQTE